MKCRAVMLMVFFWLSACTRESVPVVPTPACQANGANLTLAAQHNGAVALADSPGDRTPTKSVDTLTFADDILPLLSSHNEPRRYDCTVCHATYSSIDGFDTANEVNEALAAMQDGSMPKLGSSVRAEDISLIRAWAKAGFAADKAAVQARAKDVASGLGQAPNPSATNAAANPCGAS